MGSAILVGPWAPEAAGRQQTLWFSGGSGGAEHPQPNEGPTALLARERGIGLDACTVAGCLHGVWISGIVARFLYSGWMPVQ